MFLYNLPPTDNHKMREHLINNGGDKGKRNDGWKIGGVFSLYRLCSGGFLTQAIAYCEGNPLGMGSLS